MAGRQKIRLDQLLVDKGLAASRERAKALIMAGEVSVNGQRQNKAGTAVEPEAAVEVRGGQLPYVSRGGLKLEKALDSFAVDPAGRVCLDCGASTGGFTDLLLQRGAARVYAVDVGYGQLAWKLRCDERVVNLERTNARTLSREQVPEPVSLAVMDLAFISLRLVLPAVRALLAEDADVLCLVKPQFEAGRERVGKKGVVRDAATHLAVLEGLTAYAPGAGLRVMGADYSPIRGPEGNIEYLLWLKSGKGEAALPDLAGLVRASHERLEEGG